MILLRRKSLLTRKFHEMELPITQERLDSYDAAKSGLSQDAFPDLDAYQREFIMVGVTKEEWDAAFGGDE